MSKGIKNLKDPKTNFIFVLDIIIAVTIVFMVFANINSIGFVKVFSQEEQNQTSIELAGKLIGTTYRWVDSNNSINPTLIVTSGENNQITVKSLQNDSQEHDLIIEGITSSGDKDELVISDTVHDGSSSKVDFYPLDLQEYKNYKAFDYYCEYYPDTMRGNIKIINYTMNNSNMID
jgi:hypothetical protein